MGKDLAVKVCGGLGSDLLANGKGIHREEEFEGSQRQAIGLMDTDYI